MTKRLPTLLLLIALWSLCTPVMADGIEVINLQNRPASELIPILRPMLEPGGAISGTGFQLIVRTSPENLQQLRSAIAKLDGAARQLLITVRKGGGENIRRGEGSVSGTYRSGSGSLSIGNNGSPNDRGMTIEGGNRKGDITARTYGTDRRHRGDISHRIRTMEGQWATIQRGESIPYPTETTVQTPHGKSVQQSIEFKDATSGFEVRPRVKDRRVMLEVRPFYNRRSAEGAGIIDTHSASTTVSGVLGEWIEIGGIEEREQRGDRGIGYSSRRKSQKSHRISVKVELIP